MMEVSDSISSTRSIKSSPRLSHSTPLSVPIPQRPYAHPENRPSLPSLSSQFPISRAHSGQSSSWSPHTPLSNGTSPIYPGSHSEYRSTLRTSSADLGRTRQPSSPLPEHLSTPPGKPTLPPLLASSYPATDALSYDSRPHDSSNRYDSGPSYHHHHPNHNHEDSYYNQTPPSSRWSHPSSPPSHSMRHHHSQYSPPGGHRSPHDYHQYSRSEEPQYHSPPRYHQSNGMDARYSSSVGSQSMTEDEKHSSQPEMYNRNTPSYNNEFEKIVKNCHTISQIASRYNDYSSGNSPSSGPSDAQVAEMTKCAYDMYQLLVNLKDTPNYPGQGMYREEIGGPIPMEEDDMDIIRSKRTGNAHTPALRKYRKRSKRAAPPGRCHSCNISETPEWRRGPDGARTLCNACGLHFAKLTRKRALLQGSESQSTESSTPMVKSPSETGNSSASPQPSEAKITPS